MNAVAHTYHQPAYPSPTPGRRLDLTAEIQTALQGKRYAFKHNGEFLRGGICPVCNEPELWTKYDKPYYIRCPRENNCGTEWNIKDFLPDLFSDLNERFPATEANPNQTADVYLSSLRGLNIDKMRGWYEQAHFWRSSNKKGTATVRFYLNAERSVYWERFVDEVSVTDNNGKTKTRKMDFGPYGASYHGLWWQPPTLTIKDNSEVIWTEGIIDAISLYQKGQPAVAIMSAGTFPSEAIKPYLGKGITWVIGLDNDAAGRKHLAKHVEKLRELGEKVSAIIASKDSIKTDWNDLLRSKKLTEPHLKTYRLIGQTVLAQSKEDKAFYTFLLSNEQRKRLVIDFKNTTYSITLDKDAYDAETRADSDHKTKLAAFKSSAKFKKIAAFRLEYLYYEQPENGNNGRYTFRLYFANGAPSQDLSIVHTAFGSSTKLKEALLAAHGGMFQGDTADVNYIYEELVQHWKKIVRQLDFIGYDNGDGSKDNKGTKAYIFHDIAVHNGEVIKRNSEGYFALKSGIGIKTGLMAHHQVISTTEPVDFLDDFELAFGTKGIVCLANLLSSLFAEQIGDYLGFYYFFELWDGKGGSGKSGLAEFLLKLLGRKPNTFNPNIGTSTGASRRFADTSNMPIILNETDVEGDDDNRQHRKRWSWDDSKNLYDRMVGDSKGIKSQDNQTRTGRFRGALWVIQNPQVHAARSTLSRFISLHYDASHHTSAGHDAIMRLKALRFEDLSGFMIKALRNEAALLAEFKTRYQSHNSRLQASKAIKEHRIIDNHAHLLAIIDCLHYVITIPQPRLDEAKRLVQRMAVERDQLLQKDHPIITDFWQTFNELNSGILKKKQIEGEWHDGLKENTVVHEEGQLDHSKDPAKIAVSLVEYIKVCKEHGIYADIKELRKHLVNCKEPKFIDSNVGINSKVTGKSIKCYVFLKKTDHK